MPLSILENSPFSSFLIPGLILLVVLGVFPLVVARALAAPWSWKAAEKVNVDKDIHWSWACSLYIGFALIIWIVVQIFMVGGAVLIHAIYLALGLLIQIVTLLPVVRNYYAIVKKAQ